MATYAYRQVCYLGVSKGYVDYNITPGFSSIMGSGDTFIITGQARSNEFTIKSLEVWDHFRSPEEGARIRLGIVNKTISKGTTGKFTIECTLPNFLGYNEIEKHFISFTYYDAADGTHGPGDYSMTLGEDEQYYNCITQRAAPTINGLAYADAHAPISGTDTPLEYFGEYVQGESLPSITATFATDSRDAKLTTTHRLVITDSGDNVVYDVSGTAGALATNATLQLPAFPNAGIYTAAWTVTDSAGMSATYTDTFTVAAYTPPTITALDLVRFATTLSGDVPADDGESLWLTLAGAVAPVNSLNAYTVSLAYSHDGGTETTVAVTSDTDGGAISIAEDDTTPTADTVLYGEVFDALYNYDITLTVQDMLHTVQGAFIVLKAGGYMNVEKVGVAVGMRTTATPTDKRFEVHPDYTSHFGGEVFAEGGIAGVTNYSSGEVSTGGKWIDGKPIYRSVVVVTGDTTRNAAVELNSSNPITGVDAVISLRGIVMCSDSNQNVWPMPNYYGATSTWNNTLWFRKETGVLRAYFGDNAAYGSSKTIIAVIEYTKA